MTGMMQCAVFHGPGDLRIEQRPIPACPSGGLLVKVMACGICGSDVRNFASGLKGGVTHQIMGHEISGIVVEADGAGRFAVGDRVALAPDVSCGTCWYCRRGLVNLCEHHRMLGTHFPGGYAQYVALPQEVLEHGFVERLPEGMRFTHAAFAETASAVLACQKRIGVSLGDRVLIIGDGPVGCLHVEAARARGAGLIMLAGLDRLELARRFAPDRLLNNAQPDQVVREVLEATGGIGADAVICAVPSVRVQQQAIDACRKRGTVVIYGGVPKHSEVTQLNSNAIHYGEITLTGAFSYPATGLYDALWAIQARQIDADAYITEKLPLERVLEGIEMVRTGAALKVMLLPNGDVD